MTYKPKRLQSSISSMEIASTYLAAILSKKHPLAGKKMLTFDELSRYSFVTLLKGTHTRSITEHFFMKNNVNIVPQIEVNDTNLILSLISSGYWYSMLAPISIEKNSKCVAIPVENKKEILSVCLLWMNGKNKNPLFKTFTNEMFTTFNSSRMSS